jgi:hypothetical protein
MGGGGQCLVDEHLWRAAASGVLWKCEKKKSKKEKRKRKTKIKMLE